MEKQAGMDFISNSFSIVKMGNIGIIVSFITGGALMTPHWSLLGDSPLLIAKFILFFVIAGLFGVISATRKKALKGDAEKHVGAGFCLGNR